VPGGRVACTGSGTRIVGQSGKPSHAYLIEGSRHTLVSSDTGTELRASDAALIERIVQRDQTALATLYDRYAGMLSSVLIRILRDTQAAEEILQDIFFQLWSAPSRFDAARGSLPAWLMVIARNRAISQLRRHNPAAGEPLLETTVVSTFNIETAASQRQLLGRVKGALENLPAEQRAAVELAYFEGLTHSEIAKRTGDPLGTVKTRLRSAVETLKRTLHTAAASTT
jgi:RNA polymerase sigma-70 factor, ECF subfamily